MSLSLVLPWPPSVNNYWRRHGHQVYISTNGRAFREAVAATVAEAGHPMLGTARLRFDMELCPPNRRRFDIDNMTKAVWDALAKAKVFADDGQVDEFRVCRGPIVEGGEARVWISVLEALV